MVCTWNEKAYSSNVLEISIQFRLLCRSAMQCRHMNIQGRAPIRLLIQFFLIIPQSLHTWCQIEIRMIPNEWQSHNYWCVDTVKHPLRITNKLQPTHIHTALHHQHSIELQRFSNSMVHNDICIDFIFRLTIIIQAQQEWCMIESGSSVLVYVQ